MKKTLFKTLITATLLLVSPFAYAQTPPPTAVTPGSSEFGAPATSNYTLLAPLPCPTGTAASGGVTCTGNQVTSVNIQTYIIYLFRLAVAAAVLLAVVMITWGGFIYMTTDSVTGKHDAKKIFQNAAYGLLGALGSYLILYTINPQLVNLNLITVPKLNLTVNSIAGNIAAGQQAQAANAQLAQLDQQTQTAQTAASQACAAADTAEEDPNTDPTQLAQLQAQCQTAQNQAASSSAQAVVYQTLSSLAVNNTAAMDPNTYIPNRITLDQQAVNNALSQLPNGDVTDRQNLINAESVDYTYLQNQQVVENFQTNTYTNTSQAASASSNAIRTITQNTQAAEAQTTDPAVKQQYINNAQAQINIINSSPWHQNTIGTVTGQQ